MINYDNFRKSLKRLEEQYENYQRLDDSLSELNREGIAESVVRRFNTCYDCLWKVIKRYLIEGLGVADAPSSPKPIFRLAYENNLFAEPLEQWLCYANARVDQSLDYSGEKVLGCLEIVEYFIDDAIALCTTMSREKWG